MRMPKGISCYLADFNHQAMMKSKFVILCGAVALLLESSLSSCSGPSKETAADTTFTVTVSMAGLDTGTLLLTHRQDDRYVTDSARSTNGTYEFKGKVIEPVKSYLRIQGQRGQILWLYLENGRISIAASKDSLSKGVVAGSPSNEEYKQLELGKADINKRLDAFSDAYSKADKSNQALMDSLDEAYDKIDADNRKASIAYIEGHPASIVSAYEVDEIFIYNPDVKEFDRVFNRLDSGIRASAIGRRIAARLAIAKQTDIDQIAPDFTLNDVKDNPVALSSLRGKYLLIDFWASWCGPCRRENPNLVKAYRKFNKKGFEIVGVSLDYPGDRDKWLEAIRKDELTWLQLSDLKGWECAPARQYGINAIPMNFLLAPDGRVVAKGLDGKELEAKLETLL